MIASLHFAKCKLLTLQVEKVCYNLFALKSSTFYCSSCANNLSRTLAALKENKKPRIHVRLNKICSSSLSYFASNVTV